MILQMLQLVHVCLLLPRHCVNQDAEFLSFPEYSDTDVIFSSVMGCKRVNQTLFKECYSHDSCQRRTALTLPTAFQTTARAKC